MLISSIVFSIAFSVIISRILFAIVISRILFAIVAATFQKPRAINSGNHVFAVLMITVHLRNIDLTFRARRVTP